MDIKINYLLLTILLFCLYSCKNKVVENSQLTSTDVFELNEKSNLDPEFSTGKFRNPAISPFGSSLANTLRAFYLVGDFKRMLDFLVYPELFEKEDILTLLKNYNWGYEIKLTNVQWQPDSSFIMTYKTNINNTLGTEQYYGTIVGDTAKLYLFPENSNLLKYSIKK